MKLIILKNKEDIAKKASKIIINEIKRKPALVLGLATGKTMIPLYKELVKEYKRRKVDFSKVKTFNLDEYADKKQVYHKYMNKNLFSKVNIKKENIYFPLANGAKGAEYDTEIKKARGIDLQILGIGKNTHIGFNEPNSSFKSKTRKIKINNKEAYTAGISTIMKSKKIILLAFGKEKSEAIKKTLKNKVSEQVPASVLRKHKNVLVIVDEKAGKKV